MRILLAGASGFIGTALRRTLAGDGHDLIQLVRRQPDADGQVRWDPATGFLPSGLIDRVDAVVNLSGASLARLPWTPRYQREILSSRLRATHTLTDAMRTAMRPPRVFLSGSAVGIYGDRPDEVLTDHSRPGTGFLADVVRRWEAAAFRAPDAVSVVTLRTGLVFGRGGVLSIVELQTRLGLGGPLGGGRQHWPWITLADEVAAIRFLLTADIDGPVNLVAPTPATAGELMREFAHRLHRPYALPVPRGLVAFGLRDGAELVLSDQQVVPEKLLSAGFRFRYPTPEQAVDWMLSSRAPTRHANR